MTEKKRFTGETSKGGSPIYEYDALEEPKEFRDPFRRQEQQQFRPFQILVFRQKFLRQCHRHCTHACRINDMKILL